MKEHKKSKKAKRDALLDARWGTENEYAGATETEWDQWDQCAGTLEDDMEACRNGDYHLVGGMYGDFWGEVVLFGVEVNRGGEVEGDFGMDIFTSPRACQGSRINIFMSEKYLSIDISIPSFLSSI